MWFVLNQIWGACQSSVSIAPIASVAPKDNCVSDIYNCSDFTTQAQALYEACGVQNDVHGLDRDLDGLACETLP
jgi:hypothetical protein